MTKKLNQSGSALIYVVVALVIIVCVVLAGAFVYIAQQDRRRAEQAQISTVNRNDPFIRKFGDNCVEAPINRLSAAPVAPDQVRYIEPLGKVQGSQVLLATYASIVPLNPNAAANSYNLIMPGTGKVVNVKKNADQTYRLVISFSCRYYTVFDHVPQLNERLARVLPENFETNAEHVTDVAFEAGQAIGSLGNQPITWVMVDAKAAPEGLFKPDQYSQEPWIIHAIDPFSVYNTTVRTQLQGKSLRNAEPIGGKADYDKKGALSGNWFKTGTGGFASQAAQPWSNFLSVAPNYIDPNTTIVSLGNWEGQPAQFAVRGKVDPATITIANSPVKYELMQLTYLKPDGSPWNPTADGFVEGLTLNQANPVIGTIMFEVQADDKIRMQRFPGRTADQVTIFEASAELYER